MKSSNQIVAYRLLAIWRIVYVFQSDEFPNGFIFNVTNGQTFALIFGRCVPSQMHTVF